MRRRYLFATITLLGLVRIYFAWRRASVPFEIDYEEGNVLNAAVSILLHRTPYPHPGSFPYAINSHGPIGYLLTALGIHLFGLSLFGPRVFVLVGGLVIAALVALLLKGAGAEGHISLLFGLAYLCSPLVWNWYPLLRVDFWAIALSLAGIYMFKALPRWRILSSLLFVAAILTKPTALAAPFACAIELACAKRFKELSAYAIVALGALVSCVYLLGPDFRFAMLGTHPDPYSFARAGRLYISALEGMLLPVVIFLLALFARSRWTPQSRLLWIYAAAVSVVSLTSGKLGSETNHFLEWTAATCVIAGLALSHLFAVQNQLAAPLLAGTIVLTALFATLPQTVIKSGRSQSECSEAYQFVKSFPGDHILSEDVAALVLAGKDVEVGNPFGVNQVGSLVLWSHGTPEEMVRKKEFDLILLGGQVQNFDPASGRWSGTLITSVAKQYRLQRSFLCYPNLGAAYVPRKNGGDISVNSSIQSP